MGEGAFKMNELTRFGVNKGKLLCVKALSAQNFGILLFKLRSSAAVDSIAGQRVPRACHVNSYLMCSACFKNAFKISKSIETGNHLKMSDSLS